MKAASYPGTGNTVETELTNLIATIGENMTFRRAELMEVKQGVVASYVHNQTAEGLGRIGVLVGLESTGDTKRLYEVARQIAMHVAATNPQSAFIHELDQALVAKERAVHEDMAKASGKPAEFLDKMIDGRMRKYYEQVVLIEQEFVMGPDKRVKDVLEDAAKELGTPVELKGFIRFGLGEGIEKEETDFGQQKLLHN